MKIKNTSQNVLKDRQAFLSKICSLHGVSIEAIRVNYRRGPYITLQIQGEGKFLYEIAEKHKVKSENIYIIGYRKGKDFKEIKRAMSENSQTLTNETVIIIYFYSIRHIVYKKEGEYISDICKKYNVSPEEVRFIIYPGADTKKKKEKMLSGHKIIKQYTELLIPQNMAFSENQKKEERSENIIKTSFTCNWYNDFREDGLDFQDFQGIKNSFREKERINFIGIYQTNKKSYFLSLKVYNTLSGELVITRDAFVLDNVSMYSSWKQELESDNFQEGEYMFNFKLFTKEKILDTRAGKFEITHRQETHSEQNENITQNPVETKKDQINRLMKLFESGKISEITFNNSMRTLENQ